MSYENDLEYRLWREYNSITRMINGMNKENKEKANSKQDFIYELLENQDLFLADKEIELLKVYIKKNTL
jgi:antirestriction protein